MSVEHVLTMMEEYNVKFVDLRFTDTKGKEQHVSIPAHQVDEDFFEDGKMFDGSSMAGWKGINESDMVLMPIAESALIDPFFEVPTLVLRCDVLEPNTMQGYDRDPRSIAKRAEDFLRTSGIADTVLFGPEPEFSCLMTSVSVPISPVLTIISMILKLPGTPVLSIRKVTKATVRA